ncbi:MAG: DEAD/DEAH box helicase [Ignavibacteria bacterium]|nr:DEAD/DEAH box helicase [Ignavibacteria bacterium]MBL7992341.1 DEAD/DEAH box helicase [Candidatus Kapabacteria bacterium]
MTFDSFGLSDRLMQGISAAQYTTPTPIQQAAIPRILEGADLIGCAQTGTGKTAAFVIPLLQNLANSAPEFQQPGKLQNPKFRPVRALVLSPTRELAQQIEATASALARFMRLRAFCVYGGVSIEMQEKQLRFSTDIIIATPGRLLDLMNRKAIDFSQLEILVLDEADRMLDMGFINDVKKIVANTPPMRQTLLFSATMSDKIQTLTRQVQRSPEIVNIGERRNPSENVTQHFYSIPQSQKVDLLLHVLKEESMESVLVFSRTKHGADRIMRRLERKGFPSIAIHSNRSQGQRQTALAGFKSGKYKIMVATDVAARGIDVDGISHVINFDTPPDAEDYIHRIGRTGRASTTGDALSFVARDEEPYVRKIERHIGKRLSIKSYPGFVFVKPDEAEMQEIHREEAEREESRGNGHRRGARPSRDGQVRSGGQSRDGQSHEQHRDGHQNGYHKKSGVGRAPVSSRAAAQGFAVLSADGTAKSGGAGASAGKTFKKRSFSKGAQGSERRAGESGGGKSYGRSSKRSWS